MVLWQELEWLLPGGEQSHPKLQPCPCPGQQTNKYFQAKDMVGTHRRDVLSFWIRNHMSSRTPALLVSRIWELDGGKIFQCNDNMFPDPTAQCACVFLVFLYLYFLFLYFLYFLRKNDPIAMITCIRPNCAVRLRISFCFPYSSPTSPPQQLCMATTFGVRLK